MKKLLPINNSETKETIGFLPIGAILRTDVEGKLFILPEGSQSGSLIELEDLNKLPTMFENFEELQKFEKESASLNAEEVNIKEK